MHVLFVYVENAEEIWTGKSFECVAVGGAELSLYNLRIGCGDRIIGGFLNQLGTRTYHIFLRIYATLTDICIKSVSVRSFSNTIG